MTGFILIVAALAAGVACLVLLGAGRNRTHGDRLNGVSWLDLPHPQSRASRRSERRPR